MFKNKVTIGAIIAVIILISFWLFAGGDDKKQIARKKLKNIGMSLTYTTLK
ncbi:hypothetical protein LG307_03200 [Sutcliffiella horikoshii]|uniref:hypothetical protein n=1 Tax=Sutcliffiella horikoshii TaxID=79883 RepID=UPI00385019FB